LDLEKHDAKIAWDGDPSSLNADQMAKLTAALESIAFKDDPKGLEEWRRGEPRPPETPIQ
jgi:hypothetical protein